MFHVGLWWSKVQHGELSTQNGLKKEKSKAQSRIHDVCLYYWRLGDEPGCNGRYSAWTSQRGGPWRIRVSGSVKRSVRSAWVSTFQKSRLREFSTIMSLYEHVGSPVSTCCFHNSKDVVCSSYFLMFLILYI